MKESTSININRSIRASQILLIDEHGENLGKIALQDALKKAREAGLDLVEVNRGKNGSVCRIMDYGKWKYRNTKKAKKNNSHKKTTKEIKFRPNTGDNDLKYRAKQVSKFLESGNKVRLVVRFKGREMAHMYETGKSLLERFLELVEVNYAIYDSAKSDGRTITLMLNPHEEK